MTSKATAEQFVGPVTEALCNVLSTMAATTCRQGETTVKDSPRAKGSVSGIIPLKGDRATGSLAVTFSKPAILAIYAKMLGETRDTLDDEVANLAGEITNMVAGGANRVFSEQGYEFQMASPFLLAGPNHAVHHDLKGRTLLVAFDTDAGGVFLELCFAD